MPPESTYGPCARSDSATKLEICCTWDLFSHMLGFRFSLYTLVHKQCTPLKCTQAYMWGTACGLQSWGRPHLELNANLVAGCSQEINGHSPLHFVPQSSHGLLVLIMRLLWFLRVHASESRACRRAHVHAWLSRHHVDAERSRGLIGHIRRRTAVHKRQRTSTYDVGMLARLEVSPWRRTGVGFFEASACDWSFKFDSPVDDIAMAA